MTKQYKMGVGTSSIEWPELERRVGAPLEARRLYRAGDLNNELDSREKENVAAGRLTVTSWQPTTVSQREKLISGGSKDMLKGWLDGYPPDSNVVAICGHEPTARDKKAIWPDAATYLAGVDQFFAAVDELNQDRDRKIRVWGCHIPWDARIGVITEQWFHERWKGCAWDGYDWTGVCPDPAGIYGKAFDLTHSVGQRVGIGEFGSDMHNDKTDKPNTGRAAWIKWVRDYCEEQEAAFVLYWNNSNWLLKTDEEFHALAPSA